MNKRENTCWFCSLIVLLYCTGLDGLQAQIVKDIEGNVYKTVNIGTQVWMAENLKTTRYNDSTAIPLVIENYTWKELTTPGYCWYVDYYYFITPRFANTPSNKPSSFSQIEIPIGLYDSVVSVVKDTYGALYNWYTVNTGKLCPTGWHVPSEAEWTTLTDYLGSYKLAGSKLKETGNEHWTGLNPGATNESGFTALPGGYRWFYGPFSEMGVLPGADFFESISVGLYVYDGNLLTVDIFRRILAVVGHWWTSTEKSKTYAWTQNIFNGGSIVEGTRFYKRCGLSVRCVKN